MKQENSPLQFNVTQVEDSVGYLLARARTMLAVSADNSLRTLDITHAQASVMMMLSIGKCSTAAELAREMFIDAAAMKRTLDKIASKGWIRRVADVQDKRLFKLELTEAGHALSSQIPPVFRGVMEVGFTGFSQEEMGFLKSLLRKLLANRALLEARSEALAKVETDADSDNNQID